LKVCAVKLPDLAIVVRDARRFGNPHRWCCDYWRKGMNWKIRPLNYWVMLKSNCQQGTTTIVNGGGDASNIAARVAQIKKQIETTTSDYDREKLQERPLNFRWLPTLWGASSEMRWREKDRVDDALHAHVRAVEEGIVPVVGCISFVRSAPLRVGCDMKMKHAYRNCKRAIREPTSECFHAGSKDCHL